MVNTKGGYKKTISQLTLGAVPSVIVGLDASRGVASRIQRLDLNRPLVVMDRTLSELGLADVLFDSENASRIDWTVFDKVVEDPPESVVYLASELAKENHCDSVIGFGGGSSMDVAKLVALLAHPHTNHSNLKSVYGVGLVNGPRLPLWQIPTTAGTGSEATAVSIVTTGETTKSGVVSPVLLADEIVLDAKLTVSLPPAVTAATGIDAMVHAIEAYTSARLKNPISDALSMQAVALLAQNIETVVFDGENLSARESMLVAAMMAGQAFANAPVGGVHALAYPIGGIFHVPHGLSNSLVLPHVLRFNAHAADEQYSQLASNIFNEPVASGGATLLAEYFIGLAEKFDLATRLRDVGISLKDLDVLADQAMLQQRLLINNPRVIHRKDAHDLYSSAL